MEYQKQKYVKYLSRYKYNLKYVKYLSRYKYNLKYVKAVMVRFLSDDPVHSQDDLGGPAQDEYTDYQRHCCKRLEWKVVFKNQKTYNSVLELLRVKCVSITMELSL